MRTTSIIVGSRNTAGAAIIPATAPSTAAKPQPSASIQPTRTPSRRLAVGFTADERNARPSVVKRKNAQSATTVTRQTARVPTTRVEIVTPSSSCVVFGNGLSKAFVSAPQIQPVSALSAISNPIVTITIPPTNARASVSAKAGQYDKP